MNQTLCESCEYARNEARKDSGISASEAVDPEGTIRPVLGCTCGTHLRAYCCGCGGQVKRRPDGECSCRSLGKEWPSHYEVNHPSPPNVPEVQAPCLALDCRCDLRSHNLAEYVTEHEPQPRSLRS